MAATNVKKGDGYICRGAPLESQRFGESTCLILASRAAKGSVSREVKITAISGLSRS